MTLTLYDIFIAVTLISCVPLQHFIVQNWSSTPSSRSYTINRLTTNLMSYFDDFQTLDSWRRWVFELLKIPDFEELYGSKFDDGESPAIEVMKYKQNNGFFAMSTDPRIHRSPYVTFRVGQVVQHKYLKYRGVIVGWDETAKAPAEWIEEMDEKNKKWKNIPNYAILVDTRDRLTPQLTYSPQDNIEVVVNIRIIHPLIQNYFENYDGAQYIPRPWLRTLYPQD